MNYVYASVTCWIFFGLLLLIGKVYVNKFEKRGCDIEPVTAIMVTVIAITVILGIYNSIGAMFYLFSVVSTGGYGIVLFALLIILGGFLIWFAGYKLNNIRSTLRTIVFIVGVIVVAMGFILINLLIWGKL